MNRSIATRIAALAVGFALLAEVLVYGVAFGINVILVVATFLAAVVVTGRVRRPADLLDLWIPIAAVGLAAAVAIRSDPPLVVALAAGAAILGTASVAVFGGLRLTRRPVGWLVAAGAWLGLEAIDGGRRTLVDVRPRDPRRAAGAVSPVLRGVVLAVPVVAVFTVLFASADPIFAARVESVVGLRLDLGDLPGRVVFVVAVGWLAAGLLRAAATGVAGLEPAIDAGAPTIDGPAPAVEPRRLRLGGTEATVMLGALVVLFGAFVGLQVAYLFGGASTLAAAGLTYAEYARRGFFELVAVALLVGALLWTVEAVVARRPVVYVSAAVALVVLTGVVLVSAAFRLALYQQAYGWTELRFYVAVAIAVLAVAAIVAAGLLLVDRTRWLVHGFGALCLAGLVACVAIGPSAFVADRNLERALDPGLVPEGGRTGLDAEYLASLPDDAIPAIVAALPALEPAIAEPLRGALRARAAELATDPALTGWPAWNLARERARAALATLAPD